jgi:endonuclease/exonuclease/phosphatase family metal-dependent hydrolase
MVAWKPSCWSVMRSVSKRFLLSLKIRHAAGGSTWLLSTVYGPVVGAEKSDFLAELREIKEEHQDPWLLTGDFNMIYCTADKYNDRLNRRLMGQFHRFLNDVALKSFTSVDGCILGATSARM